MMMKVVDNSSTMPMLVKYLAYVSSRSEFLFFDRTFRHSNQFQSRQDETINKVILKEDDVGVLTNKGTRERCHIILYPDALIGCILKTSLLTRSVTSTSNFPNATARFFSPLVRNIPWLGTFR